MVMHPHNKYHWPISKDKNIMARTRKYYLKNNYLTLRSKVKVTWRSLRYVTHRLMVMHPHTKYNWPISKDKNVMARTRIYYLKNNYLTLRSKVKIPWRSLWYATHRLMVMHPHTKYNWPIWKDKKVMVRTSRRSGRKNQTKTICLSSFEGVT
jgi:acyl-CoA thioesterase FadM